MVTRTREASGAGGLRGVVGSGSNGDTGEEDAESIAAEPAMSLKVPSWMCLAERIATGSRKRVTEDGPNN
jgi:hypothetical protein